MKKMINNQSGSALVAAVAFTTVFAIMSITYLQVATSSANNEMASAIDARAFLAAESGLMLGANWVTQQNPAPNQTVTDIFSGSPLQTNGIDVQVDILVNAGDISIQATTKNARLPYQKTIASQLRNTNPFTKAVFGDGGVDMSGNGFTDSYDADAGPYNPVTAGNNGDVGTNGTGAGAVKLAGNAVINGDASTGPGGTVTTSGNAKVNGGETHGNNVTLPPVTIPADLQALINGGSFSKGGNWNGILGGGNYKFSEIDIKANAVLTVTGDVRVYLTSVTENAFSIGGNGKIVIAPGASLKIFSDGGCQIAGNGVTNQNQKPEDFQFQSTFTSASNGIKTTGNGVLHGIIYAPNTSAMIAGNGDMYGSIVCDYVKISGNGNTHYDESLANKAIEGLKSYEFVAGSWVEKNIL